MRFKGRLLRMWLILFITILSGTGKKNDPPTEDQIFIKGIELKELNDHPIDLAQFKGQAIFINFWATWCRPCIEEMPSIEQAQKILESQPIEFFLASNEDAGRIQSFIKNRGLNLNYVRIENFEDLNIQALPTTYIIDKSGELVFSETGFRKWDDPDKGSTIKATKVNRNGTKEPALEIASSSKARYSGFPQLAKSANQLLFAWTDNESKSIKVAALAL